MPPAQLPALTHFSGDYWTDGYRHFGPVTYNNAAPDEPCVFCSVQFKSNGILGYELNSDPGEGQGEITIVSAANWEFDIPSQELPLKRGKWTWKFKIYTDLEKDPVTIWIGTLNVIDA